MFDAAIIGTGPAGLSAALNLQIHGKSFIWIGTKNLSDKARKAEKISNYPGLPGITGEDLIRAYRKQIEEMGIEIQEAMVTSVIPLGTHYAVMAGPDFFEAKTVLLTTGVTQTGGMKGEAEYLGRGVSYCATCDGTLYRGKTIGIVCSSPRFEHEIRYLAGLAAQVYLFASYKECGIDLPNVSRITAPTEVLGEKRVEAMKLKSGETLSVDGVFCLRSSISMTTLLPGLEMNGSHLKVDREQATGMPGVYAAGDITGRPYQFAKAVGEGNVAAHSILDYLGKSEN